MKNRVASLIFAFILGQLAQFLVTIISTSFAPDRQLIFCAGTGAVIVFAFLVGTRVQPEEDDIIRPVLPAPPVTEDFADEDTTD